MSEDKCRILNFEMYLQDYEPIISEALKTKGIWEPVESLIAGRYIKHGDIVVDVGAHIGYYSLLFSYMVGKRGLVYAFEPDPKNYDVLLKNLGLNNISNVIPSIIALSNEKKQKVDFYLTSYITGHHSLAEVEETDEVIKVTQTTIDTYFDDKARVDFVKIDTEGNECDVLEGMGRVIVDNPQIKIMCEFAENNLKHFGQTLKSLYNVLIFYGFTVYAIEVGFKDLVYIGADELDWFIKNNGKHIHFRNIFAMKE